jgi:hypothetical protein
MNDGIQVVGHSGFANQTTIHPIGLLMVGILGLSVVFLPRRWSVLPFLIMACFVSSAQRIVIAGCDFDFLRIIVFFGIGRLLLRREYLTFVWTRLDKAVIFWAFSSMVFFIFREGTISAMINRLGFAFDAFGMYFIFRCLIQKWQDVESIIFGLLIISLPLAFLFVLENRTGHNLFSFFGGVPPVTVVREGRLRCQGAFSHPILAGCFWASLMPLFAVFWVKSAKDRVWAIIGIICAMIIVICCASSTPVMGILSAVVGGLFFYFRNRMRFVRWVVLSILVTLHIVMKAPVWHLIARVSAVGGSTGYHRFLLIDRAIYHFGDWWLLGCSGDRVASWGVWSGDVTNQYILEGVRGGILTLCLFVAIITYAFQVIGHLWRTQKGNPYRLALSWAMGVSLFVHCINYIGVSYFGQTIIIWYLLLAMIGSMSLQATSLSVKAVLALSPIKSKPKIRNQLSSAISIK